MTEVYKAEVGFMYQLFATEPGMRKRFFNLAAVKLSKKLRELGQVTEPFFVNNNLK